jgi:DNA (cytosine-5)-methyltransferase 1
MAGLKLMYGVDFNPVCCSTLRANFPEIKVFEKWAHEFATMEDPYGELRVDMLHLSPPCQVFSPVHTRLGKGDDMNFASLFAVEELIKKTRPRMVTLEQTFGILHERFGQAFNSLIRMFIDVGFSTSWQVIKFQNFGLAQSRKRLIIVAAG